MTDFTDPNNNFDQLQVGKLVYLDNVYNNQSGNTAEHSWVVPCGQQLGFNCYSDPSPFEVDGTETCESTYNFQDNVGNTQYVRAYPSILLGTLDGRDSTYGVADKVGCALTGELAQSGRCGNSKVYDLRDVQAATGFPVKPLLLPPTTTCFSNEICAGSLTSVRNTFQDMYLHNISDPSTWPDVYDPTWGDVNKINGRKTSVWNINVWNQFPVFGPAPGQPGAINFTGASFFTNVTLGGINYNVRCKHENPGKEWNEDCGGGFFFIAFVPTSPIPAGELDCTDNSALVNWVSSQDFKDRVLADPACTQIWNDLGQPDFVVDAPNDYYLAGLQIGNEHWFNTEDASTTECWSNVEFKVGNETFGKVQPLFKGGVKEPPNPAGPWTVDQAVTFNGLTMIATGTVTLVPHDV